MVSNHACQSEAICTELRKLLKRVGLAPDIIADSCSPSESWPCSFFLTNVRSLYEVVSPETSSDVLSFVSSLFTHTRQMVSPSFKRSSKRGPFHCPELDIDLFQPCTVTSCAFHTDNDWTLNCILFYRLHQGKELLSLNELAFLLGSDVGTLRANLNKSFRILSEAALKETIERDYTEELMERVHPENVCVVCEERADSKRKQVVRSGFSYCSKECAELKPPQIIRLEQKFRLPIVPILTLCVDRFSTVKHMCSALGVSAPIFIGWCVQHGVEIPVTKGLK